MNFEEVIETLHGFLDDRHQCLVSKMEQGYPDYSISSFAHRHAIEVHSTGVAVEKEEMPTLVFLVNLINIKDEISIRGFVQWDETYKGRDGNFHYYIDGATKSYRKLNQRRFQKLFSDLMILEGVFCDSVTRGCPLMPQPKIK